MKNLVLTDNQLEDLAEAGLVRWMNQNFCRISRECQMMKRIKSKNPKVNDKIRASEFNEIMRENEKELESLGVFVDYAKKHFKRVKGK